jgi:hypothetical protein
LCRNVVGGGILLGVGWIVGVVLLWTSTVWNRRDKLAGTLLLPGGLLPFLFLLWAVSHTSGSTTKLWRRVGNRPELVHLQVDAFGSHCASWGSPTHCSIGDPRVHCPLSVGAQGATLRDCGLADIYNHESGVAHTAGQVRQCEPQQSCRCEGRLRFSPCLPRAYSLLLASSLCLGSG